jgi:hypothetical protein
MPRPVTVGECSNCEGEGWVTIWGRDGHEVPASRAIEYPDDRPQRSEMDDKIEGKPYVCEVCKGRGIPAWKEWMRHK